MLTTIVCPQNCVTVYLLCAIWIQEPKHLANYIFVIFSCQCLQFIIMKLENSLEVKKSYIKDILDNFMIKWKCFQFTTIACYLYVSASAFVSTIFTVCRFSLLPLFVASLPLLGYSATKEFTLLTVICVQGYRVSRWANQKSLLTLLTAICLYLHGLSQSEGSFVFDHVTPPSVIIGDK